MFAANSGPKSSILFQLSVFSTSPDFYVVLAHKYVQKPHKSSLDKYVAAEKYAFASVLAAIIAK